MVDPVEFGKAMAAIVKDACAPLLKRIEELEAREPAKGEDGKSVTVEDVAPLIESAVAKAVAAIPPATNGKDADENAIAERAMAAARQSAEDWCKANPPADGKSVTVDEVADAVVTKLLDSPRLETLADIKAAAAVTEHLKSNPVRDGLDATPEQIASAVKAFLQANPPEKGQDGKSVTLEDVSLFLDAAIAKHLLDLERRATDTIARAIDKIPTPKDGKDGADFSKCEIEYDGERTITIRGEGGEIRKHVDIPLDRGYWREGLACEKGDIVTHDGNAWIALRDNKSKPSHEEKDDWRLFARKGRDGRDGKDGKPPPGPVKLHD